MAGETRRARLSVKHLLLLLVSMVVPAIVLVALGVRLMVQQEELSEKYRADQIRLQVNEFERALTIRLDRLMQDPSDPAIALTATLADGRLILPWDVPARRDPAESPAFDGAMMLAEREEFRDRRLEAGLAKLETAAALARSDHQRAYVRLVRARMLAKVNRRADADREYRALLASPPAIVDHDGMPFSLYAAERLLAAGTISPADRDAIEATVDAVAAVALPPGASYMLRDVDAGLHRLAGTTSPHQVRIADAVGELEHALALQRDISALASSWEATRGAWLPHGKPLWLVGAEPADPTGATVIAVRAGLLNADARAPRLLAGAEEGEWLGTRFPGLKVGLLPLEPTPVGLARAFSAAALAIVLGLTLLGGYLLWRDVEREMRLAALRSQFVSSVSHELKTPLTAIRMFAETLLLNRAEASTRTEYLETIVNETERLTRLLNNVLDFSKIEEGRKIYTREPSSLASIVQAAARAIEYPLTQHGFALKVDVEEGLPPVHVDADALEQAVLNLLTNAMKYSGRGRRITLRLSRVGSDAVIAVADEGIGIPVAEQARIFEKFYRVQTAESQRIPGTGLGLTLVDHIVRAHDGSIRVDSAPGRGSVFALHLPIVQSASAMQPAEATP